MPRPKKLPTPEVLRRVLERRSGGESLASIARDCDVHHTTVSKWIALAEQATGTPLPTRGKRDLPPPVGAAPPTPATAPAGVLADAIDGERRPRILDQDAPIVDTEVLVERLAAFADDVQRTHPEKAVLLRQTIDALNFHEGRGEVPDAAEDTREWIVYMIKRVQRSYELADQRHDSARAGQYASTLEKFLQRLRQYDLAASEVDAIIIPKSDVDRRKRALVNRLMAYASEPIRCAECDRRVRVSWAGT